MVPGLPHSGKPLGLAAVQKSDAPDPIAPDSWPSTSLASHCKVLEAKNPGGQTHGHASPSHEIRAAAAPHEILTDGLSGGGALETPCANEDIIGG